MGGILLTQDFTHADSALALNNYPIADLTVEDDGSWHVQLAEPVELVGR